MAATFVVETGQGIENANAYAGLDYVNSWHDSAGNAVWETFTDKQKMQAIVRATSYIDKRFGRRFRGFRQTLMQPLQWPRLSAFDDSGYLLGGSVTFDPQTEATNVLTIAVITTLNTQSVQIGTQVYTFYTTLPTSTQAGAVLIGGSAAQAALNLIAAIMAGAGSGVNYGSLTVANTEATAVSSGMGVVTVTSIEEGEEADQVVAASTMTDAGNAWAQTNGFLNGGGTGSVLPRQLLCACSEYALRAAINQTLMPDPLLPTAAQDFTSPDSVAGRATEVLTGTVNRKQVQVGPIQEDTFYETPAASLSRLRGTEGNRATQSSLVNDFSIPEYPEADMFLEELLITASNSARLIRGD